MNAQETKPQGFSAAKWNFRINTAWASQVNDCEDYQGLDGSMHALCSCLQNKGDVLQEGNTKRCNIFNCSKVDEVYEEASARNVQTLPVSIQPKIYREGHKAKVIKIHGDMDLTNQLS